MSVSAARCATSHLDAVDLTLVAGPALALRPGSADLWVAVSGGDRIDRVTPAGQVAEFRLPADGQRQPQAIAPGPDGAMWFTESKRNRIGRITAAGRVTESDTVGRWPDGIAASGGRLWFTEYYGQAVGSLASGALAG